jgi:hypothetical protein
MNIVAAVTEVASGESFEFSTAWMVLQGMRVSAGPRVSFNSLFRVSYLQSNESRLRPSTYSLLDKRVPFTIAAFDAPTAAARRPTRCSTRSTSRRFPRTLGRAWKEVRKKVDHECASAVEFSFIPDVGNRGSGACRRTMGNADSQGRRCPHQFPLKICSRACRCCQRCGGEPAAQRARAKPA